MNKIKIIVSIFAAIFFANFSFGMDDLPKPDEDLFKELHAKEEENILNYTEDKFIKITLTKAKKEKNSEIGGCGLIEIPDLKSCKAKRKLIFDENSYKAVENNKRRKLN
jgi:hypothetical protein